MTFSLNEHGVRGVVLDIEGTTTPLAFVHEVLFPYARAHLSEYVDADRARQAAELMDQDSKSPWLKELQGRIWQQGYANGALRGDVFDDVPGALERWRAAGIELAIYSSGSVQAQHLLFGTTRFGDLTPRFGHFFDTAVGPKKARESYGQIARAMGQSPSALLFVSDVEDELTAARSAGLQVLLAVRPGNAAQDTASWTTIRGFGEIVA